MIKKILVLVLAVCSSIILYAQKTEAEKLAEKMAIGLKDSLELSGVQKKAIYNVNMYLHELKMHARVRFVDRRDVGRELQKIELMRDSLYAPILGEEKAIRYKEKKVNLIHN